ncbi:MAG: hypothetical protein ABL867_11275 [Rickettsiales bacterium]
MKKLLINTVILAFLPVIVGCATSPHGLKEQAPDFESTINSSNVSKTSQCLLKKMEGYPLLIGFDFEDRTLPVQIRQFKDSTELYQMQGAWVVSLVELQKISQSKTHATLRVNHAFASYYSTINAYEEFIASCY